MSAATYSRILTRFRIPISFPTASSLNVTQSLHVDTPTDLESSLTKLRLTALECWDLKGPYPGDDEGSRGIVLGCQDGTLYVMYCPSITAPTAPRLQAPDVKEVAQQKHLKRTHRSHNHSRPTSPTAMSSVLSPTFNVTPKLRVVSGITTEQVEAPKNYVDFDEEPDKLKDILKGKNPRERSSVATFSDSGSDRAPRSNASSITESASLSKRRNTAPRSLLSATNSRAATPPPFSTPVSPGETPNFSPTQPSQVWKMKYHIIPSCSGVGHAIKSISILGDGQFFVTLQESGYAFRCETLPSSINISLVSDIHLYSSVDGSCKASAHVDGNIFDDNLKTERLRPRDAWTWCNLTVSTFRDVTFDDFYFYLWWLLIRCS